MTTGDDIVRTALSMARADANQSRLRGWGDDPFSRGQCFGQITIAEVYLGADLLLVMAAKNEMHFLRDYPEGRA